MLGTVDNEGQMLVRLARRLLLVCHTPGVTVITHQLHYWVTQADEQAAAAFQCH